MDPSLRILGIAMLAGMAAGALLHRLAGRRGVVWLVAGLIGIAVALVLNGRAARDGWSGIGQVAVAAILVAPSAVGALIGGFLPPLVAQRRKR